MMRTARHVTAHTVATVAAAAAAQFMLLTLSTAVTNHSSQLLMGKMIIVSASNHCLSQLPYLKQLGKFILKCCVYRNVVSLVANVHICAVVKVYWDARERRSPTSNLWVKAFPHLRLL